MVRARHILIIDSVVWGILIVVAIFNSDIFIEMSSFVDLRVVIFHDAIAVRSVKGTYRLVFTRSLYFRSATAHF